MRDGCLMKQLSKFISQSIYVNGKDKIKMEAAKLEKRTERDYVLQGQFSLKDFLSAPVLTDIRSNSFQTPSITKFKSTNIYHLDVF